ncbi:hypothetical protein FDP41_007661 [Naegleria fowleri]|uniref:PH domain-containing protein n=1 Tax=Naegleria fowleri TaxID=5763 RepID=A0A6A5C7L0_NAEFO|nr:uncharacterized protein FDP41_007661 [Naegleria fowleri]KAF0983746.1 hypothetical protein FDP41_007661 [Naegleria fowleri]
MSQNGAVQSSPMLSSSSTTISSSAHQQQQVNVSQTLMSANQNRSSLNGWTELFDPNYQRFYYHNPETGETSWYHPKDNPDLQKSQSSFMTITTTSTSQQEPQEPQQQLKSNIPFNNNNKNHNSSPLPIRASDPVYSIYHQHSNKHGSELCVDSTTTLGGNSNRLESTTTTTTTPRSRRGGVTRASDSEVRGGMSIYNNHHPTTSPTLNALSTLNTSIPSSPLRKFNKSQSSSTSSSVKKKTSRFLASISDQYYALYERVEKKMANQSSTSSPISLTTTTLTTSTLSTTCSPTLSYDSFTIKDKFIILHLTHLTSPNSSLTISQRIHDMEQDLKQSPLLFACLRGDHQKFNDLLSRLHVGNSKTGMTMSETTVLPHSKLSMLHLAVASGNIHLVKHIISWIQMNKEGSGSNDLNQTSFNSLTALHIASLFGLTQIAYLLIESGADTNIGCHATPLAPPYFQPLIEKYFTRARDVSSCIYTPFLYCVFGGSVETLLMFGNLSKSVGVSVEQNREGFVMDALSLACVLQHVKMVDIMLKEDYVFNYDVNCTDNNGMSPIMFLAWSSGNAAICGKLLAKQANLVGVNRANGYSCLHFSITVGNYGFIKKVCRTKENTEELAILLRIHNQKQPLNALQFVNSKEIESTVSVEIRKKIESILKSYGATEKTGFSEIIKEGYLTKQGHVVKNWKKRWFVLRVGELQYFKSIQKLKEPTGTIILQNGSIAKTFTKGCFVLYDSRNDKKYFILASSEEEMTEWMDAISFSINQAGAKH